MIDFEQVKKIARDVGETMTDDDLLDLMHSVFVNKRTYSLNARHRKFNNILQIFLIFGINK